MCAGQRHGLLHRGKVAIRPEDLRDDGTIADISHPNQLQDRVKVRKDIARGLTIQAVRADGHRKDMARCHDG